MEIGQYMYMYMSVHRFKDDFNHELKVARGEFHHRSFFFKTHIYIYHNIVYSDLEF